jgi:dihydropteroate synthase
VLAVVNSAAEASQAVARGAALVDLSGADGPAVQAFRAGHPGVRICAGTESADLVRDLPAALRGGATLITADPDPAVAAGLAADRVLLDAALDQLAEAVAGGYRVLADLTRCSAGEPAPAGPGDTGEPEGTGEADAGELAVAAICGWLGVTVVRTRHPRPVRRALDLAESVRGTRPPARAVRGLG